MLCRNLLLKRQMFLKGKARNDILIDNSSWESGDNNRQDWLV